MRRILIVLALGLLGCGHSSTKKADTGVGPAKQDTGEVATNASNAQPSDADLAKTCCQQCSAASSRDPSGMDISTKACSAYHTDDGQFNGGPGVDADCFAYFQAHKTTAGECWDATKGADGQ